MDMGMTQLHFHAHLNPAGANQGRVGFGPIERLSFCIFFFFFLVPQSRVLGPKREPGQIQKKSPQVEGIPKHGKRWRTQDENYHSLPLR